MAEKNKFGDVLRCIHSESVAYTEGRYYEIVSHPDLKVMSLEGDDGLYDPLTLLLSSFKKAKE